MFLKHLSLQNFRSYTKSSFDFSKGTTLIVGPNTSGKTNLIEAIFLLATGKSFRAPNDFEMIQFGEDIARVKGELSTNDGLVKLEAVLTSDPSKRYLVNGIPRRRVDFQGNLIAVLFCPSDLDIIVDSPSLRRTFFDDVLCQVSKEYRASVLAYGKALRQRNALLERVREEGRRDEKHFDYWDSLLIEHGKLLGKKREELISFFNHEEKDIFDFTTLYDKSTISKERLLEYKEAEVAAGVTLVGPHRDDFSIHMYNNERNRTHNIRSFGSRGQQRLAILQLRFLTLSFIEKARATRPMLLLDDIFSELDSKHIHHIVGLIPMQQTIITTTHKEFVERKLLRDMDVIELE